MTCQQEGNILSLLGTDPDGLEAIELQKLMFVYSKTEEHVPSYEFIPFLKGCFSPTLANDVHKLAERHLVVEMRPSQGRHQWRLTQAGEMNLIRFRATALRFAEFRRRYPLRGRELVADVYRKYPYWAVKSQIADVVLFGDDVSLQAIDRARPTSRTSLASIGYEGRSFEDYLNALIVNGITVLCDVRRNPISRKYGFSKTALQNACEGLGITYRHFPELGIPSDERQDLRYQADYDDLLARYERSVLPEALDSVQAICSMVETDQCVAVTCFEKNPAQCHRTRVLNAVTVRTGVMADLI